MAPIHLKTGLVLCLVFFFLGCSQVKPSSQSGRTTDPLFPDEDSSLTPIFPHIEGWADPSSHGLWVMENGENTCLICHEAGLPSTSLTPSCGSCHPLFPHSDGWVDRLSHGAYVLESGGSAVCATACHGADLAGGLSGVSCNSCHSLYPHSADWAEAANHGASAEGDGKELCKTCHGADLLGRLSGVSCTQCHSLYPHTDNWSNAASHGGVVNTNGPSICATQCHGADLAGGLSGVSCNSCHSLYPHSNGWEEYSGHGVYALANSTTECQLCHGTDYQGGGNGSPSCNTCHTNYPHLSGWNSADQHGVAAYGTGKTSCATANCHGVNYEGNGAIVPSCFSCHGDYPHIDPLWISGAGSTHASTFINEILSGSPTICTECHGTDYSRNVGGTSCTSCHPDGVTHTTGWSSGTGHGQYYSSRYTAFAATSDSFCTDPSSPIFALFCANPSNAFCTDCHGSAVIFAGAQTQSSLAGQSDCYSCHWAYPHIGWNTGFTFSSWDVDDSSGWSHAIYVTQASSLLLYPDGSHPTSLQLTSPACLPALENTCGGGTAGNCHSSGTRTPSFPHTTTNVCGVLCH